jgi:hypothetical protein
MATLAADLAAGPTASIARNRRPPSAAELLVVAGIAVVVATVIVAASLALVSGGWWDEAAAPTDSTASATGAPDLAHRTAAGAALAARGYAVEWDDAGGGWRVRP